MYRESSDKTTLIRLKHLLAIAPVLKIVDQYKDFVVWIDASKGVGGVPTQEVHVICYDSRKLKYYEINYDFHILELLAIIYALKIWQHYFLGNKFMLLTDNYGWNIYLIKRYLIPDRPDGLPY